MTIVGLEAWCDYVTEGEYRNKLVNSPLPHSAHEVEEALEHFRRGASFRVQEFAVLADGRRLTLSNDRGFSGQVHVVGKSAPIDHWPSETLEQLEADVCTTVLPDDDTEDEHPWEWLAQRLRAQGVEASPEQLKQLPYDVVFSQRLRARVMAHTHEGPRPPQA